MKEVLEKQTFYDVIFKRKSVRKFEQQCLSMDTLNEIEAHLKNLAYLFPEIDVEIKIVSPNDINGLILVKAPYYLAIFSEIKEGYLENAGFMLQQMDLYFSANGIGSCWQGWPKPTIELRNNRNLEFVIAMAFGIPKNEMYRSSINEFKRKPLDKIRNGSGFDEIINAARLAPSPSQPWFFDVKGQKVHLYCSKTKGLWASSFEKIKKIEMGVAICHLWVATKHFNRKIEFCADNSVKSQILSGFNYTITATIW